MARANSTATCNAGECERTCVAGFADCDGNLGTGCEADLSAPTSCGACARSCSGTQVCTGGACTVIEMAPPPRLLGPLSGVRVARRRPELSWVPVSGGGGTELQVCRQRDCNAESVVVTFESSAALATPPMELAPGVYFWRARTGSAGRFGTRYSPTWQFRVPVREGGVGGTWGAEPDFNGDGFADVATGAPFRASEAGGTYVFYGSTSGPSATPSWTHLGTDGANSRHGICAIAAGDMNGDGYVDLGVGSSEAAFTAGRVHVYFGGPMGLSSEPGFTMASPEGTVRMGEFLSAAGDVNRDGYADLAVGAPTAGFRGAGAVYLFTGRAGGVISAPASTLRNSPPIIDHRLSRGMAAAGDVNGDGMNDLVAGACATDTTEAGAYLFAGEATGLAPIPTLVLQGRSTSAMRRLGDGFGCSVAGAGDVNGDGFYDVLVGATSGPNPTGYARLFLGSSSGLTRTHAWEQAGTMTDGVGASVSGGADVNGDGYDDVLIVSGGTGTVRVWYGAAGGPTGAGVTLENEEGSTALEALSGAIGGDVDGDGYADVLVGSPGANEGRGRVRWYRGGRDGVSVRPSWSAAGTDAGGRFGTWVGRW